MAALLVVFAVAAWRVPGRVATEDRQLLARVHAEQSWTGMQGPVPSMLGVLDERSFRRAVVRFLQARRTLDPIGRGQAAAVVASTEAAVLLARIESGRSAANVRSRAANLDAVVVGEGAELNGDGHARARVLRRAPESAEQDRGAEEEDQRPEQGVPVQAGPP
jgi:hypothetical protein